ncbi:MAG: ABC transporter permease [Gemmataceae bacterium]
MRLSVVSLISRKETADLLRDRRTVTLVFLAPLVLYPLFGLTAYLFASELIGKPPVIGVANAADAVMPVADTPFPPLLDGDGFNPDVLTPKKDDTPEAEVQKTGKPPVVVRLDGDPQEALKARRVQAVLVIPSGFAVDLEAGKRPKLTFLSRDGDDKSKVAVRRLGDIVGEWEKRAKAVRFQRDGKPADYDQVVTVDNLSKKPPDKRAAEELRDSLARIFPLLLVLWVVAGAIQPAVDLTAGEKERGTMETLLISPAERSEIVLGKFVAVTFFAFSSVLWNVVCLTAAALVGQAFVGQPIVNLPGMAGCVVLGVPIAMLFSAISLALGVFARSTKEGQYYLVPLMLVAMPLAFWSMIPSTELTPLTAVIPITGPMLLQQKLLSVTGDPIPWGYFAPVLGAQAVYVGLALLAAWWEFRREGSCSARLGRRSGGGSRRSEAFPSCPA